MIVTWLALSVKGLGSRQVPRPTVRSVDQFPRMGSAAAVFIALAHGRVSWYVKNSIGAASPGRWQPCTWHTQSSSSRQISVSQLLLRGVVFHHLDADMVRSLDEGVLDLAAGDGARLIRYFDAGVLQALQRLIQVIHAEADVVRHVALG